jgi:uncharacterized protein
MVSATRTVTPLLPAQTGTADGLAFSLWLPSPPQSPARAGVVVLHGADSCKESHHDFARAAVALGLAVICFDQKGHGASEGRLGADVLHDVAAMALRGSSMGGYLAILASPVVGAGATVAICPASADGLRRGLRGGRFSFRADRDSLAAFVDDHDPRDVVRALTTPLLLMHAEGDEQVPITHSRELAALTQVPGSRLVAVPGGHHRSVQHDEELQAVSLRFIARTLAPAQADAEGD